MSQTRRLAAILAADIAGYSRLIGANEEGTLERLRSIRAEVIDRKITEHRGRIVKTTGDGLLVEFSSVVDALRSATQWQHGMGVRNADVLPTNRIEYRIGAWGFYRTRSAAPTRNSSSIARRAPRLHDNNRTSLGPASFSQMATSSSSAARNSVGRPGANRALQPIFGVPARGARITCCVPPDSIGVDEIKKSDLSAARSVSNFRIDNLNVSSAPYGFFKAQQICEYGKVLGIRGRLKI
jgi:hypothetical protein